MSKTKEKLQKNLKRTLLDGWAGQDLRLSGDFGLTGVPTDGDRLGVLSLQILETCLSRNKKTEQLMNKKAN